jgi:chromosome partitioning protein
MPVTYVIAHTKGGTGKTTISVQASLTLNARGKRVWHVDGDNQRTSMQSMTNRETVSKLAPIAASAYPKDSDMRSQVRAQARNYDYTVIDCGGGDSKTLRAALLVADVVIAPLNVGIYELWALDDLENVVHEINATREKPLACRALLNCADPGTSGDNRACRDYASESALFGTVFKTEVVRRKPIGRASARGLAISEYSPRNNPGIVEIDSFINELLKVEP